MQYVGIRDGVFVVYEEVQVPYNPAPVCMNHYCDKPALYTTDVKSVYCDDCIHEVCYSDGDI